MKCLSRVKGNSRVILGYFTLGADKVKGRVIGGCVYNIDTPHLPYLTPLHDRVILFQV